MQHLTQLDRMDLSLRALECDMRAMAYLVGRALGQGAEIMASLDDLITQVEATTTVGASAVQMIEGLSVQLKSAAADPVRVKELADQLRANAAALGAAIVANTPAAPPAPVGG